MTPERLAHIKAHFLNPPSASCNREWALEVCGELERALRILAIPSVAAAADADAQRHFAASAPDALVPRDPPDELTVKAAAKAELDEMLTRLTTPVVKTEHGVEVPPISAFTPIVIDDRPTPPESPKKRGKR